MCEPWEFSDSRDFGGQRPSQTWKSLGGQMQGRDFVFHGEEKKIKVEVNF